jgi:hypothetical protein
MNTGGHRDGVGGVDPNLPSADPQQLSQGSTMPGQVKAVELMQTAIGKRGVGEQQMAAQHQIEAVALQRKLGQCSSLVSLRMGLPIGEKQLQYIQFGLLIGAQLKVGMHGWRLPEGLHREVDVFTASTLQLLGWEFIERVNGEHIQASPTRQGSKRSGTPWTVEEPGLLPIGQIEIEESAGLSTTAAEKTTRGQSNAGVLQTTGF